MGPRRILTNRRLVTKQLLTLGQISTQWYRTRLSRGKSVYLLRGMLQKQVRGYIIFAIILPVLRAALLWRLMEPPQADLVAN